MILKISAFVALSSLLISCNNSAKESAVTKEETVNESEHHHEESTSIELNNGKKWTVDKDMMVHIRNMENDVASFAKSTDKDYEELSKKLLANIDLLTSNCTMTGKAHDELHKWLLPYIDLVGELEAAENEEKSAEFYKEIEESFHTFNEYFN
jgi:hypothetical protein